VYKEKTDEIIAFYDELDATTPENTQKTTTDPRDVRVLVKRDKWIPIQDLSTGKFRLFNYKNKILHASSFNEQSFISHVQRIQNNALSKEGIRSMIEDAIPVFGVAHNPFESRNFYYENEYDAISKTYRLNETRPTEYRKKLQNKIGDEVIDLMLRSIRKNDEIWLEGFCLTEIILAWQTFHSSKIMAIPCIYSKDRGIGKTTWLMVGEYLYDKSNKVPHYCTINMGDENALQWGDSEANMRVVLYDDVPNDEKIVKKLSGKIKANATRTGDRLVNIKGKGQVYSNAFNSAITTNHLMAIPLDNGMDDRRIHPIHVRKDDYTLEELEIIGNLDLPMSGERNNEDGSFKHFPLIQKMLDHLYYVYLHTKESKKVKFTLLKEVPDSKFKNRIAQGTVSTKKLFPVLVNGANDLESLISSLNANFNSDFGFLKDSDYCIVSLIQGKWCLSLKNKGLVSLGTVLLRQGLTAQQVYNQLFQHDYEFKIQGIGDRKTAKCVRFPMKAHK
jgi:hypothetical protein